MKPKPQEISIYAKVPLEKTLKDHRRWTYGLLFGTVEDVARQYGIKINVIGSCIQFTAPKSRLQMFIEKLHFGKIPYSSKPF